MLTTLLAIAAVFIGLWITGTELNISSLMGMVMIVGNVTEVAIFYYSEYIDFPTRESTNERLIEAGRFRMRHHHDYNRRDLRPAASGIGHRAWIGDVTAFGHCDYRGTGGPVAAGSGRVP